ncbi:unnamed protein product [Owenia fusiformis]|uniref:Uncharacterized protein n=1 Tax=Owenia fusiformis TaxID=6347 RepID=A0A8J1TRP1_OWEFU|nr:unnamed protein product [Owenia fusiformis]
MEPEGKQDSDDVDISVIRGPIELGLSNLEQVVRCVNHGTNEVKQFLYRESNVILECNVCKSLFRALPNFIAHKRCYCKESYCDRKVRFVEKTDASETVVVLPESPIEKADDSESDKFVKPKATENTRHNIVEQMQEGKFDGKSEDYKFYSKAVEEVNRSKGNAYTSLVKLTPIKCNPNAVKQKVKVKSKTDADLSEDDTKCENSMDTDGLGDNVSDVDEEDIVTVEPTAPPGPPTRMSLRERQSSSFSPLVSKLSRRDDCDITMLTCLKCNTQYSSIKTLHFHMNSLHSEQKKFYPCLYCSSTFSQIWGVTRHLQRRHGKSKQEVEKLRDKLRRKSFTRPIEEVGEGITHTKSIEHKVKVKCEPGEDDSDTNLSNNIKIEIKSKSGRKATAIRFNSFHLFKCDCCGKGFAKKSVFDKHKEVCTWDSATATSPPVTPTSDCPSSPPASSPGPSPHSDTMDMSDSLVASRPKRVIKLKRSFDDDEPLVRKQMLDKSDIKQEPAEGQSEGGVKEEDGRAPSKRARKTNEASSSKYSPSELKYVDAMIDYNTWTCKKCEKQYGSVSSLRRHAIRHMGWRRFKCKLCKFTSFNRSECKSHLRRIHAAKIRGVIDLTKMITDLEQEQTVIEEGSNSSNHKEEEPEVKELPKPRKPIYLLSLDDKKPDGETVTSPSSSGEQSNAKFNISTRKTPRKFDITPYEKDESPEKDLKEDKNTSLVTRSGYYPKKVFLTRSKEDEKREQDKKKESSFNSEEYIKSEAREEIRKVSPQKTPRKDPSPIKHLGDSETRTDHLNVQDTLNMPLHSTPTPKGRLIPSTSSQQPPVLILDKPHSVTLKGQLHAKPKPRQKPIILSQAHSQLTNEPRRQDVECKNLAEESKRQTEDPRRQAEVTQNEQIAEGSIYAFERDNCSWEMYQLTNDVAAHTEETVVTETVNIETDELLKIINQAEPDPMRFINRGLEDSYE